VTIQFESHRVELAAIYEMENDPHVLEYFDQPPSIKLSYSSADGKNMGVLHTPDFFVIRDDAVGRNGRRRRTSPGSPNIIRIAIGATMPGGGGHQ